MKRKDFLKKTIAGFTAATILPAATTAKTKTASTYDKLIAQVGFNHLPNKEIKSMKTVLHKAATRGYVNHGWLEASHSFSFANYRNPERMHFGVLRVLNDDKIDGGKGFGMHPHDNMEIITIPLEGDLEHKDSMGNQSVIKEGEVQVMSAGTGVFHSEYNKNAQKAVKLLQIWLFPNQKNVVPRYEQMPIKKAALKNKFYQILSPNQQDEGVWIHQNAWFHWADFDTLTKTNYTLKMPSTNGVYAFVLEGEVTIEGQVLTRRDGFGIWDTEHISVNAGKGAKVLLMEVPMKLEL